MMDKGRLEAFGSGAPLLNVLAWQPFQAPQFSKRRPRAAACPGGGADWKGRFAAAMYLVGMAVAFVAPWLACLLYATVAAIWFLPDWRIESRIKQ